MFVSVAGLIGSGKSTLVKNLEESSRYVVYYEPVESNPFLELYYKDPCRWSYAMQVNLLFTRYKQSQEAFLRSQNNEIAVIDSSIYSDMAFALVQYRSNYFTNAEFKSYLDMHKTLAAQTAYPNIVLFLKANIDTVIKRINYRSRECESSIQKDYLLSLMNAYDIILNDLKRHTDIVYLDANKSADEVYSDANSVIDNYKNNFIYY